MQNLKQKLLAILSVSSSPLKFLLYDPLSRDTIFRIVESNTFFNLNFFYFSELNNPNRDPQPCVCYIFVSVCNINLLYKELQNNLYNSYIVCVTAGELTNKLLVNIAEIDTRNKIDNILEINLNISPDIPNLYVLNDYKKFFDYNNCITKDISLLKELTEQDIILDENIIQCYHKLRDLFGFIQTLYIEPSVIIPRTLNKDKNILINHLHTKLLSNNNLEERGTLIYLERDIDYITPILYDFRYCGAIRQQLNTSLTNIELNDKQISIIEDDFFINNRFNNLHSTAQKLKDLNKISIDNLSTDKKDSFMRSDNQLIDSITQNNRAKDSIINNLSITESIITSIQNIKEMADIEYEIVNNKDFNTQKLTKKDNKYYYKNIEINIKRLIYILKHLNSKCRTKLRNIKELSTYNIENNINKLTDRPINYKRIYNITFEDDNDLKLSMKSPIAKIIRDFLNNIIKNEFMVLNKRVGSIFPIILYIEDGICYNEVYQIEKEVRIWKKYNKINKEKEIFIVSDSVIYNTII